MTLTISSYSHSEAAIGGEVTSDAIEAAIEFLGKVDPHSLSDLESEMTVMHVASIVSPKNLFKNNTNIKDNRKDIFINHMSLMLDSDAAAWCRKLYDYGFWSHSRIIANLIWNWLRGTLSNPSTLV